MPAILPPITILILHVAVLAANARVEEPDRAHVNGLHALYAGLAGMAATFLDACGEVACEPVLQQAPSLPETALCSAFQPERLPGYLPE